MTKLRAPLQSADYRLRIKYAPGRASNVIHHVKSLKNLREKPFVLWCRVSARGAQHTNQNVNDQETRLRQVVADVGGRVAKVFHHTGSGWDQEGNAAFLIAVATAKREGAILLAESTDRFVRHRWYHSGTDRDQTASIEQLEELRRVAKGIVIATLLDPDASPDEVRSFQAKRGQWAKNKKGGRPMKNKPGYKKQRREEVLPTVRNLILDGKSLREISKSTGVPLSTIQGWIARRE